ncbi:RHS repeat-associated core domain-containing protein [Opitutus sp. ER46]|uniref:RHS repeat domain-containing protein n=1 Tax=Opitutus sp. ER46 TaxID=2161864 RepID=UPI000D32164B|nr:RHS repeat-associated core domain-containing protein [Opitutus sp. ER46]PTX94219.1 hypothetical protein DB354_10665 [Opitutus sp. ER46]
MNAQTSTNWQDFGVSYEYDDESYLLSVKDTTSEAREWWKADLQEGYDYRDRPVLVQKGSGYWTKRTYRDTDGVLTGIATGKNAGDSELQRLNFKYDGLGNLRERGNPLAGPVGVTEALGYDVLNRLTSSAQGTISYFENGNIKRKPNTSGASPTVDFGYDVVHPHAVTDAWGYSMGYDAGGNLNARSNSATGESWNFRYTGFDKPRWMTKKVGTTTVGSEFLYDARRSRTVQLEYDQTSATNEPSHYVRKRLYAVGPALEVNYDNTAANGAPAAWHMNQVRVYVPGPEGVIGTRELTPDTSAEKALVYHYDHLGSIEAITPFGSTDGSLAADGGGKAGRFSEDAWGQRRNPLTWSGAPTTTDNGGADSLSPRGFTGHEMLDDLGLVHMNGRIYDPVLGRFFSADSFVQFPGNLQSYNRYSYVQNNPLSLYDPTGFLISSAAVAANSARMAAVISQADSPAPGPADIAGAVVFTGGMLIADVISIVEIREAKQHEERTSRELKETQERIRLAPTVPNPAEKKPLIATPAEVRIDEGAIQSNGQGDRVKTNQSPTQETKQDAPKQDTQSRTDEVKKTDRGGQKDQKEAASDKAKGIPGKDLPGKGESWVKLKGNQGWRDADGNTWKKDQLHKDHWDVSDRKENKIREVDYKGNELWPNGPKNKNK